MGTRPPRERHKHTWIVQVHTRNNLAAKSYTLPRTIRKAPKFSTSTPVRLQMPSSGENSDYSASTFTLPDDWSVVEKQRGSLAASPGRVDKVLFLFLKKFIFVCLLHLLNSIALYTNIHHKKLKKKEKWHRITNARVQSS